MGSVLPVEMVSVETVRRMDHSCGSGAQQLVSAMIPKRSMNSHVLSGCGMATLGYWSLNPRTVPPPMVTSTPPCTPHSKFAPLAGNQVQ